MLTINQIIEMMKNHQSANINHAFANNVFSIKYAFSREIIDIQIKVIDDECALILNDQIIDDSFNYDDVIDAIMLVVENIWSIIWSIDK